MTKPGDRIDDYTLISELGKGGNGQVWLASGPTDQVALKLLSRRSEGGDRGPRFNREIQALEILREVHGVLPILRAGETTKAEGQRRWFTMPVATPLRKHLGEGASFQIVCEAVAALADALARVHAKGVSHRDIKPENLYWWNDHWCLGDFGLADWREAHPLTDGAKKLGPVYYIAPEMLGDSARSECRPADVYSLGKVLWVLASGQNYPFPGVHETGLAKVSLASIVEHPCAVSVDELLRRMSQVDPSIRPDAASVAGELKIVAQYRRPVREPHDPTAALLRLRAAVQPHLSLEAEAARLGELADTVSQPLSRCIEELAQRIEAATGVSSASWHEHPAHWKPRATQRTARTAGSGNFGRSFTAGGVSWKWQLGVGARYAWFSDGSVHMAGGYSFDRLLNGTKANTLGTGAPWYHVGDAPMGTPSCSKRVQEIVKGIEAHLEATVEEYARRIESTK